MSKQTYETMTDRVQRPIELVRTSGQTLTGGEIIALRGSLGTGKTHFIKGIALGLEVHDADTVTSPTFTLINEYEGRLPLFHIDAYRLKNASQLEVLGFDEICQSRGVTVIEWADRVLKLVNSYHPITIYLEHRSENQRFVRLENLPESTTTKIENIFNAEI